MGTQELIVRFRTAWRTRFPHYLQSYFSMRRVIGLALAFAVWAPVQRAQDAPAQAPGNGAAQKRDVPTGGNSPTAKAPPTVDTDTTNAEVDQKNGLYIRVWRTIMAPKNVADTFGHRIASKYIAMQVTIANRSKDYQWLIQDAAVDVKRLVDAETKSGGCTGNLKLLLQNLKPPQPPAYGRFTSEDLTLLRGVAEKGQSLDPRNLTVHSFTAAGVVAAGLIGVMRVGRSYAPGVAAFNGPLLSALQIMLPDYTVNQLNRLNDSAFLANTVVGKQQAKVIVLFIPQSDLLTSQQQKDYYKDPESIYSCPDLRMLEADVDGNFIANVTGVPVVTAVTIDSSEAAKFQTDNFTAKGSIIGNFFAGATVTLVTPPDGLTIKQDGDATDTAIKFILTGVKPLMPGTSLDFAIAGKTGDPAHVNYAVNYAAPAPTVASIDPRTVKAGDKVSITLKGTHFQPQGMKVVLNDSSGGLTPGTVKFDSTTEIEFDIAASTAVPAGNYTVKVSTTGGLSDSSGTLEVTK